MTIEQKNLIARVFNEVVLPVPFIDDLLDVTQERANRMLDHAYMYLLRCDLNYSNGAIAAIQANHDARDIIAAAMDANGIL